ncbi:hypothetical protein LS68_000070 [Helicobacter sp. MIT 05-5293]|uniref:Nmad2 family putative nucleotide modification protein n=1 Tax=Helicobacter sp. MIT 05-5293 TaxID=1548149 RepID=UPI00051D2B8F|nr:hypothetical protein [Helicobacter sp. MIT 05-5293]TLD81478.1 hypothetical protein LS68_000070 [Helicobacter sp. MIT 05-5293]
MSHRIRSYKMKVDCGFAPNYSCGVLTLATCKPYIRESAKVGEYLAGWSSKALDDSQIGQENLIYLAKISQILTFAEYWEAYPQKRPPQNKEGDNIYKPLVPNPQSADDFEVIPNAHHPENEKASIGCFCYPSSKHIDEEEASSHFSDKDHDLKSFKVLICDEFYYFGSGKKALQIPAHIRPKVPKRTSPYGNITEVDEAQAFIDYVKSHKQQCTLSHL